MISEVCKFRFWQFRTCNCHGFTWIITTIQTVLKLVLVRCCYYVIQSVSVGVNENHCGVSVGGNNSKMQVLIAYMGRYSLATRTTHKYDQIS